MTLPAATICALYKNRWQVELFFVQGDQAAPSDQAFLRYVRECRQDANLDRRVGLRPCRHHQEAPQPRRLALHFATDLVTHPFREDALAASLSRDRLQFQQCQYQQPAESIRFLTGQQWDVVVNRLEY
jgi:hypothetical protein